MAAAIMADLCISLSPTSEIEMLNLFRKRAKSDLSILRLPFSDVTPGSSSFIFKTTVTNDFNLSQSTSRLDQLKSLNDIAYFDVIIVFQAYTAFEAFLDFFGIVFESSEG